jgi:hypothetical protein
MSAFDRINAGLAEAIAHAKSKPVDVKLHPPKVIEWFL